MNEEQAITIEDLKRRANAIKDMAEAEARACARERGAQMVAAVAVAFVAAVSVAYFLGTRRS